MILHELSSSTSHLCSIFANNSSFSAIKYFIIEIFIFYAFASIVTNLMYQNWNSLINELQVKI